MCQTIATKSKVLSMSFHDCFYLQCPFDDPSQATAHANGYTQFVTLFAVPAAFIRGSYLCPSFHFVYCFLRFPQFRFIHELFYCFRCMVFTLTHKAIRKNTHIASQSHGSFHYTFAPLRHSFTSVRFSSPLPIICVPGGLLWLRVCHVFCILYTFLCYNKKARQTLAYDVAVHHPFRVFVATTIAGTRRQFRHTSSIGFGGTLLATVWASMPHGFASFGSRLFYL